MPQNLVPFSITAQPAITKLRRQVKQLEILRAYTTGSDLKQVDRLIDVLNSSVTKISENCPNGMTTSVVIKKSDLKKVLDL